MTLMFAYGSNLNLAQMHRRCPNAKPLGRFKLPDWRLVFRGVADCIPEEGSFCYGGAWVITDRCEEALDIYEGVDSGMYRKEYIRLKPHKYGSEMLVYCMNSTGIAPPSQYYFDSIKDGYRDFGMPKEAHKLLRAALQDSWDNKAPSHIERQRRRRQGRPTLAPCPTPAVTKIATEVAKTTAKDIPWSEWQQRQNRG
jgi:hypothetical protein